MFLLFGKCPPLTLHFRFPQNQTPSPIAVPLHEIGKLRKMSLLPSAGDTFSDLLRKLREVSCHLLSKHFWVFIFANMCFLLLQHSPASAKHASSPFQIFKACRAEAFLSHNVSNGHWLLPPEDADVRRMLRKQGFLSEAPCLWTAQGGISVKLLGWSENNWTWSSEPPLLAV